MKRSFVQLIICALILIVTTGCMQKINIVTDAYSDLVALPRGFQSNYSFSVIEPASSSANPLLDREIKYKIEKILVTQGYAMTTPECADFHISFMYGINFDTKQTLSPVYNPGTTVSTEGSSNSIGSNGFGHNNFTQTTTTSGYIDWVPVEVANNTRWLAIKVFKAHEKTPVWDGSSISTGESGDVRHIINYLLVTNLHYFGKSTQKQISKTLSENDESVKWLSSVDH